MQAEHGDPGPEDLELVPAEQAFPRFGPSTRVLRSRPSVTAIVSRPNATSPAARATSHATGTPAARTRSSRGTGEVRVVGAPGRVPAPGTTTSRWCRSCP